MKPLGIAEGLLFLSFAFGTKFGNIFVYYNLEADVETVDTAVTFDIP